MGTAVFTKPQWQRKMKGLPFLTASSPPIAPHLRQRLWETGLLRIAAQKSVLPLPLLTGVPL